MNLARSRFLSAVALAGTLALASACNEATENYKLGQVTVNVVAGTSNTPVGLVPVDLYRSDGTLWRRGLTASGTGSHTFGADEGGVIEGSYFVRLVSGGQFPLAAGETNDRAVTVTEGSSATLTFKVQTLSGPTPPG